MSQSLDEAFVAFSAFIADDTDGSKAKEIARQLREKAPTIAQQLVQYGAGKKKSELDREAAKLNQQIADLTAERDELRTEFDEFKAKTPDAAAIEARVTEKFTKKLKEKDDLLQAKDGTLKGALSRGARERLVNRLSTTHKVDSDYAREVLGAKYGDRLVAADDGKVSVLQLGSTEAYDAETEDQALDLLAADVMKSVPDRYVITNADRGGGTGGGSGGGNASRLTDEQLLEKARNSGLYRGIF